ncbi:M23 family metallopeptidase [Roseibium sp. SCP14]|uniref:M23 family metallopeptidase n=1 Tax=Roseibium sp. SCP14 TaxID=3141375 RepID=UPI00333DCC85
MLWRFGSVTLAVAIWCCFSFIALASATAQELELTLPLDCKLGHDCFVQNYVDIDPGSEVLTAFCNRASYDGHKGTDFRVLSTEKTADVVAAAPGVVRSVRSDTPDKLVLTNEDRARVQGKECGNGVLIDHGGDWQTQYCHLRQSSVVVGAGDRVERGQKLGEVGYSGFAAFPHVHLAVRKDGVMIDPFLRTREATANRKDYCLAGDAGAIEFDGTLWQGDVAELVEDADGSIIQTGFADNRVSTLDLETEKVNEPAANSPALVFFARLINLQKGDRVALRLVGPTGIIAETEGNPLDRNKAQWVAFAGRKLKIEAWPTGEYVGTATLIRNGVKILEQSERIMLGG